MATRAQKAGYKAFSFEFSGLAEIDKLMEMLPRRMDKVIYTRTLKKAAAPILAAALLNVRGIGEVTGNLARSLKVDVKLNKFQMRGKTRDRYRADVYVGSTAPHAHLVEWGTKERERPIGSLKRGKVEEIQIVTTTGGRTKVRWRQVGIKGTAATGSMPATPFLTPAWDTEKHNAWNIFKKEIGNELIKAVRALRKRAEKGTLSKRLARELAR